MQLSYPAEWKFGEFEYAMPDEAHSAFIALIEVMTEGVNDQQSIYEDFKAAFGGTNGSSTTLSWANSDMHDAIRSLKKNAARYVAAFYSGMASVRNRGIAVPSVDTLNRILENNGVPLLIRPPNLILNEVILTHKEERPVKQAAIEGWSSLTYSNRNRPEAQIGKASTEKSVPAP